MQRHKGRDIFAPISTPRSKPRYIPAEQYNLTARQLAEQWSNLPSSAMVWYGKSQVTDIATTGISSKLARLYLSDSTETVVDTNAVVTIYIPERKV